MSAVLCIDYESRSAVDLRETGVAVYVRSPTTDLWCMAWAFDDEEPAIWRPGMPVPERIVEHVLAGGETRAWNMAFEFAVWNAIFAPRYGAPPLRLEQAYCSMAEAAAMALPIKLETAASVLGVAEQKDMGGHDLMIRMAKPRKTNPDGTHTWWDLPDRRERLEQYCMTDVKVERALYRAIRRLTPREREVYLLDQRMNTRGITVDVALVRAAQKIVEVGLTRAENEVYELTNGAVDGVMSWNQLRLWVNSQGVETDSVDRATRVELLARPDLPPLVRRVLKLVDDAGQTSVAKLPALLNYADPDDHRARNLLQYHAAGTGRWGGRGPQPQNFKRPELDNPEQYIPLVLTGDYDLVNLAAPPITVVTDLLRACLTAAPGHDLIVADYASVEAVVLNWLADEREVLESFRQYLAGDKTKDPYKIMAVKMGRAATIAEVTKEARQAGKSAELGAGFGLGWRKYVTAAWDVYQVRVNEEQAQQAISAYRTSHPRVVQFWYDANDAVLAAVREPGTTHRFGGLGNLRATKRGGYLYIILPSGRPLCYARPQIVMEPPPWGGEPREAVTFEGVLPMGKAWGTSRLYGGLIVQNCVQAVARDLLAEGLLRVEAAGYVPLLGVHDEAICEVPEGWGDVKEFERLLSQTPEWATGCPLAAEGYRSRRYRK